MANSCLIRSQVSFILFDTVSKKDRQKHIHTQTQTLFLVYLSKFKQSFRLIEWQKKNS